MKQPLERAHELDAIHQALVAAANGEGRLVVIEAGPGLGKSLLLEAARELAEEAHVGVLSGIGSPLETTFSFGVVQQLLAPAVHFEMERNPFAGAASAAEPLFLGTDLAASHESGFGLLNGLYWLTVNLAEHEPRVLLVDDLHWTDVPSIRYLAHLRNRLVGVPASIVIATRPPESVDASEELEDVVASPGAVHLEPHPLTREGVCTIVRAWRGRPDPPFCQACIEATAGNPLYLHELLVALEALGIDPSAATQADVEHFGPSAVSRSVHLTLTRSSCDTVAVAHALAILGDGAGVDEVAALAGVEHDAAINALAALTTASILRPGAVLTFAHPIVHDALYEALSPIERAEKHASAAQILTRCGADPSRVAAHLLEAPPAGSAVTVDTLRTAAATALAHDDPETVVRLLRRALVEPPPPDAHAKTLLELGRAEFALSDPKAVEHLQGAVERAPDAGLHADAARELGSALYASGRYAEAAAVLAAARDAIAPIDSVRAAALNASWAQAFMWSDHQDPDAVAEAYQLVDPRRAPQVLGERLLMANVAGFQMLSAGDRELSLAQARVAWGDGALLAEAGVEEPALWALTAAFMYGEAWQECDDVIDAVVTRARREGNFPGYAAACLIRSFKRLWAGDLARADADVDVALGARGQGLATYAPAAPGVKGLVMLELDRQTDALAAVDVAPEVEAEWIMDPAFSTTLVTRSRALLGAGRAAEALDAALRGRDLAHGAFGNSNPAILPWGGAAGRAAATLGDLTLAREYADCDLETARRWGAPWPLGRALCWRGVIESARDSLPFLEEAVSVLEDSPARIDHARALIAFGTALRVTGHRTDSRDYLRQGDDLAVRCGAMALTRRAREELKSAGARPLKRQMLSGPASLTAGELRVADLAAQGMTNREIAEALFVTKKAVEYHLSHVYRKLEVSGRGEIADALGREPSELDTGLDLQPSW